MSAQVQGSEATLSFGAGQAALVLHETGAAPDHAEAYGRIAFACPAAEVRQERLVFSHAYPPPLLLRSCRGFKPRQIRPGTRF